MWPNDRLVSRLWNLAPPVWKILDPPSQTSKPLTATLPCYRPDCGDKTNIQTWSNCLLLGLEITRNCSKLRLNCSEWQQQHLLVEVFSISTISPSTPFLPTTSSPNPTSHLWGSSLPGWPPCSRCQECLFYMTLNQAVTQLGVY